MRKIAALILSLLFVQPFLESSAQSILKFKSGKITVAGTSTMHDWESAVEDVAVSGDFTIVDNQLKAIKSVTVTIQVKSIKSTKGRIMDNKTYDAFKADKNPTIVFKLLTAEISGAGSNLTIHSTGSLTMAGTTKSVTLEAKGKLLANGDLQLSGSKKLNMKDFAMEPPTAMMGAITVGEEVTVNFDITVSSTN